MSVRILHGKWSKGNVTVAGKHKMDRSWSKRKQKSGKILRVLSKKHPVNSLFLFSSSGLWLSCLVSFGWFGFCFSPSAHVNLSLWTGLFFWFGLVFLSSFKPGFSLCRRWRPYAISLCSMIQDTTGSNFGDFSSTLILEINVVK